MNKMLDTRDETVVGYTTSTPYTWVTDWMLCHDKSAVDVLLNIRNVVGNGPISWTHTNDFEIRGGSETAGPDPIMAASLVRTNESTSLELQPVCRAAQDPRAPDPRKTCGASWDDAAAGNSGASGAADNVRAEETILAMTRSND